ncbi:DUF7931 domain-containing protein [Gilvimarinus sp. F26214L]|uniref:DUF7931 domain-containing protein n=1 Tax=Gilvimarinus sp. DZF01 TaxID=3461371 RepID=UPI0040464ACA
MKERQSDTDEQLFLLEDVEAFAHHALRVATRARREMVLLSGTLDPILFDHAGFADAISALARSDRNARVRILVKQVHPLIERGHRLLELSRRLSSKVEIRKLTIEPENDAESYLIGDRDKLLYQHEPREYQGFANYNAGPEVRPILEVFDQLWARHSEQSPALRRLVI